MQTRLPDENCIVVVVERERARENSSIQNKRRQELERARDVTQTERGLSSARQQTRRRTNWTSRTRNSSMAATVFLSKLTSDSSCKYTAQSIDGVTHKTRQRHFRSKILGLSILVSAINRHGSQQGTTALVPVVNRTPVNQSLGFFRSLFQLHNERVVIVH